MSQNVRKMWTAFRLGDDGGSVQCAICFPDRIGKSILDADGVSNSDDQLESIGNSFL